MRKLICSSLVLACVLLLPVNSQAEETMHINMRVLSAMTANRIVVASHQACLDMGYHVAAAVVGRDGNLLSFVRSPLAGPHTVEVAKRKAYTANTFKTPTSKLKGNDFMRDIPGVLIFGGGLPIMAGGHYYGAIAVSGAPALKEPGDVDEKCAKAGISAILDDLEMAVD